jgi:hypothetical protein
VVHFNRCRITKNREQFNLKFGGTTLLKSGGRKTQISKVNLKQLGQIPTCDGAEEEPDLIANSARKCVSKEHQPILAIQNLDGFLFRVESLHCD